MMTKVQLNRLQKLHDYVKTVKPKDFHMMDFRMEHTPDGNLEHDRDFGYCTMKDHSCGTVGCLMGHTPFLFRTQLKKAGILQAYDTDWGRASEFLFGINESDPRWDYLFDSDWQFGDKYEYDMLPQAKQKQQALKRIRTMLKTGGELTEKMKNEMRERHVSFPESYDEDDDPVF